MKTLAFLVAILFLSCSNSQTIEQQIGKRMNACSASTQCTVKITDVTDFWWDQMHVFEAGATLDEIQKSIGTNFPGYVEFTRRIVFLKNGAIVYREDEPTNVEHPVVGQVSFAESYTDPHWSFTPANAVFRAEKKTFSGGTYYVLTQVK
jgi:hypothetical protein